MRFKDKKYLQICLLFVNNFFFKYGVVVVNQGGGTNGTSKFSKKFGKVRLKVIGATDLKRPQNTWIVRQIDPVLEISHGESVAYTKQEQVTP
jgi:hypothetical protein